MQDEQQWLLRSLHESLAQLDPAIVGELRLLPDALTARNGQIILQVFVDSSQGFHPSIAHCHIIARIGGTSFSEPLDACIIGVDADRARGLTKAAQNWTQNVSCLLFSLLLSRPVLGAEHFDGQDHRGVMGCHGFIGPLYGLGGSADDYRPLLDTSLFDFAEAMAPPGLLHLAKANLEIEENRCWSRTLEIDGHRAVFKEANWDCGVTAPPAGIAGRFAVFHFGDQPAAIDARRTLDESIRQFVAAVAKTGNVDHAAALVQSQGVAPTLVQRVAVFIPLAFFHVLFADIGVKFSLDYLRIRTTGDVERCKLMREPAFARSCALCPELATAGLADAVKMLATSSSTFNAVNAALNAGSNPKDLVMGATAIADPGVDDAAYQRGIGQIQSQLVPTARPPLTNAPTRPAPRAKPWWRFW